VTVLKVGDQKQQVDELINLVVTRMKEIGVSYKKNIKKNYKIAESDVTRASVA